MQKILIICGPTSTGKTALGLDIATHFNGQLISADSRQVYREMDIGTGKDKPIDREIWLYDVAEPTDDFNVNAYVQLARVAISNCQKMGRLPIIVGGTGFYIKSLLNPPDTLSVPIDMILRSKLSRLSKEELQLNLQGIDLKKWEAMNNSDRQNPRRLIRAIEVAKTVVKPTKHIYDVKAIGLVAPQELINDRIKARIESRIDSGFDREVKQLIAKYPKWTACQSSHTPGYRQWINYLHGDCSKEVATETWYLDETHYAKRQLTWFKKQPNILWFDITSENWYAQIRKQIDNWIANGSNYTQN